MAEKKANTVTIVEHDKNDEIVFSSKKPHKVPALESMSEEEFNRMMETSLKQAENGEGKPVDEVFKSLRANV